MSRPPTLSMEVRLEKWNRVWDFIFAEVVRYLEDEQKKQVAA